MMKEKSSLRQNVGDDFIIFLELDYSLTLVRWIQWSGYLLGVTLGSASNVTSIVLFT